MSFGVDYDYEDTPRYMGEQYIERITKDEEIERRQRYGE